MFGAVPLPPQRRQRPRHLDVLTHPALLEADLDQVAAPVVGKTRTAAVGGQRAALRRGGVQREAVSLPHRDHRRTLFVLLIRPTVEADRDSSRSRSTAGMMATMPTSAWSRASRPYAFGRNKGSFGRWQRWP
jgi:hypothetical protein